MKARLEIHSGMARPAKRKSLDEWTRRLEGVEGFCVFDSVKEVLLEFGGLTIRASGPGVDLASGRCVKKPTLAVSEGDRFALRSEEVGVGLCPIGEAYDGHCFMAMDEVGRVYFVMDKVFLVADSIWGALRVLVLGRSPGSTG